MMDLFLASSSPTRKLLLSEAGYSFEILTTSCNTEPFDQQLSLKQNVEAAAACKAAHVNLPAITPNSPPTIYVITADTLIADVKGEILQKPRHLAHGKQQLMDLNAGPCTIGTACIIQVFTQASKKTWKKMGKTRIYGKSSAEFYVPIERMDEYFERLPMALYACGSGIIEEFGAQFLKKFTGSYSAALGLPMFEVSQALSKLGYRKS